VASCAGALELVWLVTAVADEDRRRLSTETWTAEWQTTTTMTASRSVAQHRPPTTHQPQP